MTETAQARCHLCAGELPAVGASCPRCAPAGLAGGSPSAPSSGPHAVPFQPWPQAGAPYPGMTYPGAPYLGAQHGAPYPGAPYPGMPYAQPSFPGAAYPGTPQPGGSFLPPYAGTPYAVGQQPFYGGVAQQRPRKEVAIAILLTVLWVGAGHLYLGRTGMGAALMAAHFVLGLFFLVVFAPLGFLFWVGAVVCCSVWCANLTSAINAGTAPATATW